MVWLINETDGEEKKSTLTLRAEHASQMHWQVHCNGCRALAWGAMPTWYPGRYFVPPMVRR